MDGGPALEHERVVLRQAFGPCVRSRSPCHSAVASARASSVIPISR